MSRFSITNFARCGIFILAAHLIAGPVFALQDPSNPPATPSSVSDSLNPSGASVSPQQGTAPLTGLQPEVPRSGIARNFSEWTAQGGWVMYPIYMVFILGAGVIIYQFVRIYFDRRYTKPFIGFLERQLKDVVDDSEHREKVRGIWDAVAPHPKSELGRLLALLCDLWQRDPSAQVLQVEIDGHVGGIKEKYEMGRSFAVLLSDTAGALGLLGTVLGMYQTFMPGRLESSQVITGMGVALVTTIGGLIVSIVLNFMISWGHSAFYRHLEWIVERADLFRNRFGRGQSVSVVAPKIAGPVAAVPLAAASQPVAPPLAGRRIPASLRLLSAKHQSAEAGASLPKPLEVAVEDQNGRPIENLTVVFETNGSLITFDNGAGVKEVDTDFLGRAKTQARLGKMVGRHKVLARVNGEANLVEEFEIDSRPGAPDKITVLSGNLQIQPAGARLPEPLSVQLEDAHGNPVPEQTVMFEVIHNSGSLDQNKSRLEVHTDQNGVASIGFRLGDEPGANIVKAWVKGKTARKLEASFENLGKE
ncbi:hypothetical protein EDS67_27735 [candidate division KSB1 bacterium]|nr:MAG: hypothetical protein EDS67_27735 [candidate division KSB1 bacterium]MCE7943540.1 hypothetical protein [Chlorobi bacterium CHB1]